MAALCSLSMVSVTVKCSVPVYITCSCEIVWMPLTIQLHQHIPQNLAEGAEDGSASSAVLNDISVTLG